MKRFKIKDPIRWRAMVKFAHEALKGVERVTDGRLGLLMMGSWSRGYDAGLRRGRRERRRGD